MFPHRAILLRWLCAVCLCVLPPMVVEPAAAQGVRIDVDATDVVAVVNPRVFGTNFNPKMESDTKIADFVAETGLTVFRFPGGAGNFDWKRGWARRASEGAPVEYYSRPEPLADFDRLLDFVDGMGVELLVELNVGTGSADDAADLVRYTNLERGVRVSYWDLGNEVWLGNWDGAQDFASYWDNPAVYADKLEAYAAAMKAVDPTIRLGMGTGGSYYDASSNWDRIVLSQASEALDYVSLHWYPNHTGASHPSPVDGSLHPDPYVLMANSLQIPAIAQRYRELLEELAPARAAEIEITLTEWEGSWDTTNHDYDPYMGMWSLANGLMYADAIGQMIRQGVTVACHYDFQSNNFGLIRGWEPALSRANGWELNSWDGQTVRPKALALQLWSRHFERNMIRSAVSGSPSYLKPSGGWDWPDAYQGNVPYVASWAGVSEDGRRLSLMLINRHETSSYDATIELTGFHPQGAGESISLTGPTLRSQNDGHPGIVALTQGTLSNLADTFAYEIGPRSATVLSLVRGSSPDTGFRDSHGQPIRGLFGEDRRVGFDDFLLFAHAFGSRSGDAAFQVMFDLDPNGRIDFDDFLLFVANYGKVAVEPPDASVQPVDSGSTVYFALVQES